MTYGSSSVGSDTLVAQTSTLAPSASVTHQDLGASTSLMRTEGNAGFVNSEDRRLAAIVSGTSRLWGTVLTSRR